MNLCRLAACLLLTCHVNSARADSAVVFNEIMYHPLTNEPTMEWVELHNQHAVDIDLSGWRLDGGIDFDFAAGTVLRGGSYLVVASSPAALMAATGVTNLVGPFRNRLANAGDTLRLRNNDSRIIDEITFASEGDWPVAPDGAGPSLARRRANVRGADAANWLASAQVGGTPGAENFPIRPPTVLSNTLVAIEGSWKFNDLGTDLGSAWRDAAFDDSSWASGSALFFQEDAPLPAAKNTPLTPGRLAYYFRTKFDFTGDAGRAQLLLRPLVDDGAVGYLNGVEIFRVNMPAGAVAYGTLANGQVGDAAFGPTLSFPPGLLLAGTNVLAVEVHQASLSLAYAQTVLDSGPVAYWRLGETSGAAVDAASAPAAPQSGAQNGTYAGFLGSNLGQPGPRSSDTINAQALAGFDVNNATPRFAGNTDSGNDVVTVPDTGVFNFASTRVFTIEAWVNGASAQESGGAIIAKGTGGGGEQFAIDVVSGLYRFFAWDGGTPNTAFVVSASIGPNNTWQHVVAVLDQPAGRMKIYVNGVERGSGTPRATLVNTLHEVSIGARKNSGSSNYDLNFDGRIDEVAIYNRALPTNEIAAHFNAAFATNTVAGPDTNDVVFGLDIVAAETVPDGETTRISFNELASSTNAAFWLELINCGRTNVDLGGWVIARLGGATNREYTLPSQLLAPGQLLTVTKAEMGFGADSSDRFALYMPGRLSVADAVVAKKDPRGRSPDGTGAWWFPNQPTPGASNSFVVRNELVINEVMFHQRELPPATATFSPTNVLVTITNLWRYHAQGIDLGTVWRVPGYDDSAWPESNAVFYAPTQFFALPAPKNTFVPLTNGAGARIITFYFRTQFMFSGDTNGLMLALHPIIDDGAVFHLNGVEVHRLNMPTTNILYGTLATVNVGIPIYTAPVAIPAASLVQGLNTLAVEVHQIVASSSDMDFGTELLFWNQLTPALPFRESSESWVEIFNRSSNAVSLAGWRLDEGIDYRFASNKTIAPGGYLVVAKDEAFMQALHPGLDVVGPFTNKLGRSSDYFVLKDPDNNPADAVRFFSGGRWPEYADAGGSSLELRDPHADNTAAEAWAASDESSRGQWQTFTWRGVSAPGQATEPVLWHEFALCVLDGAGEVLLDDVSIIETPATTPKQLLENRGFNGGSTTHWRFMGNHRRSRVEPEPGNPGNFVLHLIASGAGEYQGNQIETTLTNNVAIVDGREYEISFRARWLAGKSKLNARLYFNRLARTFDLAVPARSGTPGAVNSRFAANIGPTFSDLSHSPVVPAAGLPVTVSVAASDPDGIASMTLRYSINGGAWQSVPMTADASTLQRFNGTLPGQPAASIVQFFVEGADTPGASATFPAGGTNSRALYAVQDNAAIANGAHNLRLVMTPADATLIHTGTNTLSNELLGATVIYDEREATYDVGVRLKGSFVGRNVDRVGFHLQFPEDRPFRGVHHIVSVDRSQHAVVGGVGEIVVKHVAQHAGGIPSMLDDIARFIHSASPGYNSAATLRPTGFDNDWLDAQFSRGSDGEMFEIEVLRWHTTTVDGNPESPKNVGGGNGYANLEVQDYGDAPDSYRWFLLKANNRTEDDFTRGIAWSKALALTGASFDAQAAQVMDVEQWLRVLAFESLVGTGDAYFTGANIHNFRVFVRPEDGRVIYMPWDWDSAFQRSTSGSLVGGGNIAKLVNNTAHNHRQYLCHLNDIIASTYNGAYLSRWTTHYGALAQQDLSSVLNYVNARASYVLGQLPTATFAITNNGGFNFTVTNGAVTLSGTAPLTVNTILVNGFAYPITWISDTVWRITLPLYAGTNTLDLAALDKNGRALTNALDSIVVTNTGPAGLLPVVVNEWMADNAGPYGVADPADGLFQDWFELFNPNPIPVNLGGHFLTDNLDVPAKWRVPTNTLISAGGFLLVWADKDTNQNSIAGGTNVDLHADFNLSGGGEAIGLFAPDGATPVATVAFGPQSQNISQGRFPNGDTNAVHSMTNWTPRAANSLTISLAFTAISIDASVVTLTWTALPGRAYRVEFKDTLDAPDWTQLGSSVVASASTASTADPTATGTQRFYRVLLAQ